MTGELGVHGAGMGNAFLGTQFGRIRAVMQTPPVQTLCGVRWYGEPGVVESIKHGNVAAAALAEPTGPPRPVSGHFRHRYTSFLVLAISFK